MQPRRFPSPGLMFLTVLFVALGASAVWGDIEPPGRRTPTLAWISNQADFPGMAFIARDGGPWGVRYYRVTPRTRLGVFYKMHNLVVMAVREETLRQPEHATLVRLLDEGDGMGDSLDVGPQPEVSPPPGRRENDPGLPGVPALDYPRSSGDRDRGGEKGYSGLTHHQRGFFECEDKIAFWDSYIDEDKDPTSVIAREYRIAGFQGENLKIWLARETVGFGKERSPQVKEFPNPFPDLPKVPPDQTWKFKTLHDAARAGDLEEVQSKLASGAEVNGLDRAQRTAMHWAAENGHDQVVALLLEKGGQTDLEDCFSDTPLSAAEKKSSTKCVELLRSKGKAGVNGLFAAIEQGNDHLVKTLIERGVGVTVRHPDTGDSPLHAAARFDRRRVTAFLLAKGAEINGLDGRKETPLFGTICYQANRELVEMAGYLIGKGARLEVVNGLGITPLIRAVMKNATALVKLFVQKGADPNQPDTDGKTPLGWADNDAMRALLKSLGARK